MVAWQRIPGGAKHPIERVYGNEDFWHPESIYKQRYSTAYVDRGKPARYAREIFEDFDPGSSVLLLGGGHSFNANFFSKLPQVGKLISVDMCPEAAVGLSAEVEFLLGNFLDLKLPEVDYVFSSHTVEHLPRQTILEVLMPKVLNSARKAVIFVVPYGNLGWEDEPEHKVRLTENDELAGMASRFKRLLPNGEELVLWFDPNA